MPRDLTLYGAQLTIFQIYFIILHTVFTLISADFGLEKIIGNFVAPQSNHFPQTLPDDEEPNDQTHSFIILAKKLIPRLFHNMRISNIHHISKITNNWITFFKI